MVARPAVPEQVKASKTLLGNVRIEVSPASAQVTYSRNGETQAASAGELQLPEGNYVFTARAPGYVDQSVSVAVEGGGTQNANLNLVAVNTRKAAPQPVVHSMNDADWDKPWSKSGEWFTRLGGNFVLYKITPASGTYEFTLRAKGSAFSGPKVRWLARYVDERNYIVFELERQSYSVTEYRDGKKTMHLDKKKLSARSDVYSIRMTIDPDRLTVALTADGGAAELDDWKRPSPAFTDGRFGFYFPGDAQMWLANFTFTEQKRQ
jgi:hypothetical protein